MLIVDAHQDLAWNALTFGRDYSRSVSETRAAENGGPAVQRNGNSLVGLPELLRGQVAVVFGTLFVSPARRQSGDWDAQSYTDAESAHRLAQAQLDYYHRLADEHERFTLIGTRGDLTRVLASWEASAEAARRVGVVPLMEGADPIRVPEEVEQWQARGVRIVGLSWSGTRYGGGTGEPGPLTPEGRRLVDLMSDLGLMLDLAHASDETFNQALDRFQGTVIVSHANCRALMNGFSRPERMLTDDMIRRLAEAGGVMGVVPYNRFLKPTWQPADGKDSVTLADVVAMIDHICQLTGNAKHAGLGSDFDGGFGVERVPAEIDTVADLQKLAGLLSGRGYGDQDVAGILGQNWVRILHQGLPA
jgi:membrane dipeptidase